MNEFATRGGHGFDDDSEPEPIRKLTPAEAQKLRSAHPSVSPWRVVAVQAAAGLICVALAWVITQQLSVAWSALYGAAAVVIPNVLLARGMTRRTGSPVAAAAGFMFWEMLKIGASIAMLAIAARVVPHISWPALLLTMLVGMKVNWLALLWQPKATDNTRKV